MGTVYSTFWAGTTITICNHPFPPLEREVLGKEYAGKLLTARREIVCTSGRSRMWLVAAKLGVSLRWR